MKKEIVESSIFPRLDFPELFLILANLIPIIGVLFWSWSIFEIFIVYWIESAIIGFYFILKLIVSTFLKKESNVINLLKILMLFFFVPFFIVHYGGFMFGHLIFIFALTNMEQAASSAFPIDFNILIKTLKILLPAIISLLISHGISFFNNFIIKKEYEEGPDNFMFSPYKRIIVMHITLLFGGFLMITFKSPGVLLILLIVIKIFVDLYSHKKEHEKI